MRNGDSPSHSPIAPLRRKRRDEEKRRRPAGRRPQRDARANAKDGAGRVPVVVRLPRAAGAAPAGRLTDGEILIVLPPKKIRHLGQFSAGERRSTSEESEVKLEREGCARVREE